jgi:hypothetical protein
MTGAVQLNSFADTRDGFCDLSAHANADEMRQVDAGIEATRLTPR